MNTVDTDIDENETISFYDYKINYNNCLGNGTFGRVYELVRRPENEKGLLPYLFPYVYDRFFPVNEKEKIVKTGLCVKVYKTAIEVLFQSIDRPLPIARVITGLFQPFQERQANQVLTSNGLTKIKLYKTDSLYSQCKTLVNGHTFEYYLKENYFTRVDQYQLRIAFVNFLHSIAKAEIIFEDIHSKNIMFDEQNCRWEIVDGYVRERTKDPQHLSNEDRITHLLSIYNLNLPSDSKTQYIFRKLTKAARKGCLYNENMDHKILAKSCTIAHEIIVTKAKL